MWKNRQNMVHYSKLESTPQNHISMNIQIFSSEKKLLAERPMPQGDGFSALQVPQELLDAANGKITLSFSIPLRDIHGFWAPDRYYPEMRLPWTYEFTSSANRFMPFFVWTSLDSTNRGAFALTCLKDDARFSAAMSQAGCIYEMSWTVAVTAETEPFEFLVCFDNLPFTDVITAFRNYVVPMNPAFPDAAWQPVYCTWYAAHAAYTIDFLDRNAALAKEFGFGSFILDDGWSYDTVKRLTPATCPEWFSEIGSWKLSEKKLPDFMAHVRRVQSTGMNYIIWFSPYLLGTKHEMFPALKNRGSILMESDDGSSAYDPADKEMMEYTCSRFLETFKKYGFDGVKIDFIDFVRPNVDAPHGRAAYAYVNQLVGRIRDIRPGALVEFRQFYTTPVMLNLATNFRANDVPFDFMANLHRCALIRAALGDHVPVHSDPVWFHPEESSVNVSRHMKAALMGVPMISVDLEKLTPRHAEIIKRHIAFYHDHLETFRQGHWTIRYRMVFLASVEVESDTEKITFLVTGPITKAKGKSHIILNLSPESIPFDGESVDADGHPAHGAIPEGGMGVLEGR